MATMPPIPQAATSAAQTAASNASQYAPRNIVIPFQPRELGNTLVSVGTTMNNTGQQLLGFSTDLKGIVQLLNHPLLVNSLQMIESNTTSVREFLLNVAVNLRAAGGVIRANLTHLSNAGVSGLGGLALPFDNAAINSESMSNGLFEVSRGVHSVRDQLPILRNKVNDGARTVEDAGHEMIQGGAAMVAEGRKLASL